MNQHLRDRDDRILAGVEPAPPCYSCKAPATHVSDNITPAGYRSYQCADDAARAERAPLWGSDPGWKNRYIPIGQAVVEQQLRGRGLRRFPNLVERNNRTFRIDRPEFTVEGALARFAELCGAPARSYWFSTNARGLLLGDDA